MPSLLLAEPVPVCLVSSRPRSLPRRPPSATIPRARFSTDSSCARNRKRISSRDSPPAGSLSLSSTVLVCVSLVAVAVCERVISASAAPNWRRRQSSLTVASRESLVWMGSERFARATIRTTDRHHSRWLPADSRTFFLPQVHTSEVAHFCE